MMNLNKKIYHQGIGKMLVLNQHFTDFFVANSQSNAKSD